MRAYDAATAWRRRRAFAFALVAGLLFFSFELTSRAHEPITTKVRFNKEVIRILQRSCLGCHHSGGVAMSLATYDEARPWAKAIKEEVLEKRMPPWRAVKGYGEFRNATPLTQREVDLIVNWVEGGAPKGDEKDLPPDPVYSTEWPLGRPDLILKAESESKLAAEADEHRSFILPTSLKEDRWLTAIDLRPGSGAIVHCAKFYVLGNDGGAESQMMPIKPGETPSINLRNGLAFATWMPGQKTAAFENGVAHLLTPGSAAGSRLAVTIHYRGLNEPGKAATEIGLYFAKNPPTRSLHLMPVTGPEAVIQVGAEQAPHKASSVMSSDAELIGLRPLVHPLLVSFQATAFRPDGTQQVLIWTRGYQFHWEPTYHYKQPIALQKGTRLEVVAYFDNSESNPHNPNNPPMRVRLSELTADPLCVFLIASPAT